MHGKSEKISKTAIWTLKISKKVCEIQQFDTCNKTEKNYLKTQMSKDKLFKRPRISENK